MSLNDQNQTLEMLAYVRDFVCERKYGAEDGR